MPKSKTLPLVAAVGAAFLASAALSPLASAAENPFTVNDLSQGYNLASNMEGACGGDKAEGEGKCGEEKAEGEGKCGGEKADAEGKCGEEKADTEGKCGEGKCGN